MPETPRPRGAHSWDRWPPGQGGSGTRDPSLNKQVEVMSQPLHHLEFPELRFWEERKEESAGPGWFGPNSNKLLCFWGVRVVPAPASLLKGHGISGNPHPHPEAGLGLTKAPCHTPSGRETPQTLEESEASFSCVFSARSGKGPGAGSPGFQSPLTSFVSSCPPP